MLKYIIAIALLVGGYKAVSQSIEVKNFRWVDPRYHADQLSPNFDQNGKKCTLIKVTTNQADLVFDFGLSGKVEKTKQYEGEIWLWVDAGVQKVTISSLGAGVLCSYPFGKELEEDEVYVMTLKSDIEAYDKNKQVLTEWVTLNSSPNSANIHIDDYSAGKTPFNGSLTIGTHKLRMEFGETKEMTITIASGQKISDVTFEKALEASAIQWRGSFIEFEESPEFPGGYESMMKFIHDNAKYPALAKEGGIQGTVFVQFVISETGKMYKVKVMRGIGGGCDEEAIRVVKMMPKWNAGRIWNAAVSSNFQIPIKFLLPVN